MMDPVTKAYIDQKFEELRTQLSFAAMMPKDIEGAFFTRLQPLKKNGISVSSSTQSLVVPAGGGTFSIPAQPSGALPVLAPDGTTYYLLYQ